MQSEQLKYTSRTYEELIANVELAFEKLDPRKIDDTLLTLRKCMESSIMVSGGSSYDLLHMRKSAWRSSEHRITNVVGKEAAYNLVCNIVK